MHCARHSALFGLVATFFLQSPYAQAQAAVDPFAAKSKPSGGTTVILGAGVAVRPTFEGSDRYFLTPLPLVSINYDDMISLDTSGLSAYWRVAGLQIGGGLTYSLGRRQSGSLFTPGDERLAGLGDVPAALGLRAFANYRLGPVILGSTFTKYLADGNNGIVIDASVEAPYRISDRTTITGRLFATWADQSYMQTYFGVTPLQSIDSGYAVYQASSGIKDVGLGLSVRHLLDERFLLSGEVRVGRLTGYAEGSPITVTDFNARFLAMVGYRF